MYEIININGAKLIFSPFKDIETASLGIFLRVGSRFEKKNTKGIAHFLEHVLFKGTKNYSCQQIKREIEGRGGSLNAFTSKEITGYWARFLNKNLDISLDILLDMVNNPLIKECDVNKERNVILEEIKMYNDLGHSRAMMLLDELLWEGHPLGDEIIGSTSVIKKIQPKELEAFKNRYYRPSNMVISFSGAFAREKMITLLNKKIKKQDFLAKTKSNTPFPCRGLHISCERKVLEQSHLCFGFRSVSYLNPERLIVQVINIILGANMSSRLFEELREKKSLCYDISTEVKEYKDSGAFLIHIGLNKNKIKVAILSVIRELSKIKEKEVSARELSRAKDYLLGQMAMALERPQGRMFYMAESYVTREKIHSLDNIKREIKAINAQDIKRLAGKIFKLKDMCISCVGNIDDNTQEKIRNIVR